jgi:aldose sugar dehydrogenase
MVFVTADDRVLRERRWLRNELRRIRDVRIGAGGSLYVVVDDAEGSLYRLDSAVERPRGLRP